MKANKYKMELQELKAQATHLATECKKALMLVKHPGTAKAINLCNSFLMPAARQRKDKMNESLCLLWEGQYLLKLAILFTQCLRILHNVPI